MKYKNKPYFLNNPNWYYYSESEWKYKLTDKATKEAIKSYVDFYADDEIE
jgi:hypothetical protein